MLTHGNLTIKQQKVIESLVSGFDQQLSAKNAGVAEQTVCRWMKDPAFQQGLQAARKEAHDAWLADFKKQLRDAVPEAVKVLRKHLKANVRTTGYMQMRSIESLLDKVVQLEELERLPALEAEIAELQKLLGAKQEDDEWQQ